MGTGAYERRRGRRSQDEEERVMDSCMIANWDEIMK